MPSRAAAVGAALLPRCRVAASCESTRPPLPPLFALIVLVCSFGIQTRSHSCFTLSCRILSSRARARARQFSSTAVFNCRERARCCGHAAARREAAARRRSAPHLRWPARCSLSRCSQRRRSSSTPFLSAALKRRRRLCAFRARASTERQSSSRRPATISLALNTAATTSSRRPARSAFARRSISTAAKLATSSTTLPRRPATPSSIQIRPQTISTTRKTCLPGVSVQEACTYRPFSFERTRRTALDGFVKKSVQV